MSVKYDERTAAGAAARGGRERFCEGSGLGWFMFIICLFKIFESFKVHK